MQDASIYNEHFIISGYMVGIDNDRLADRGFSPKSVI